MKEMHKIIAPGIYADNLLGSTVELIGTAFNADTLQLSVIVQGDIGMEVHRPAAFEVEGTFKRPDGTTLTSPRFTLVRS